MHAVGTKPERTEPLLVHTVAVTIPVKKRGRKGLWFLVFLLLLTGATAGVAILYPEEFKQAFHLTMARLRPWIDRVKQAASGQQPDSPTASRSSSRTAAGGQ